MIPAMTGSNPTTSTHGGMLFGDVIVRCGTTMVEDEPNARTLKTRNCPGSDVEATIAVKEPGSLHKPTGLNTDPADKPVIATVESRAVAVSSPEITTVLPAKRGAFVCSTTVSWLIPPLAQESCSIHARSHLAASDALSTPPPPTTEIGPSMSGLPKLRVQLVPPALTARVRADWDDTGFWSVMLKIVSDACDIVIPSSSVTVSDPSAVHFPHAPLNMSRCTPPSARQADAAVVLPLNPSIPTWVFCSTSWLGRSRNSRVLGASGTLLLSSTEALVHAGAVKLAGVPWFATDITMDVATKSTVD
eukprot:3568617-Rhodomonas_salina.7